MIENFKYEDNRLFPSYIRSRIYQNLFFNLSNMVLVLKNSKEDNSHLEEK